MPVVAAAPATHADWPLLDLVQGLSSPAAANESRGLQVLRRLPLSEAQQAITALMALPSLGSGEPLAATVRHPLELTLQRSLPDVRVHTSPVAERLGAHAFTTGAQIVFAPGRLDTQSPAGLALIGHELAHVGQPLAFKQIAATHTADSDEHAAEQQETLVQRIIEQGWPSDTSRAFRHTTQPLPPPPGASSTLASQGLALSRSALPQAGAFLDALPMSNGADRAPPVAMARAHDISEPAGHVPAAEGAQHPTAAVTSGHDVEALARQVYAILKTRLRAERDRHHLYNR